MQEIAGALALQPLSDLRFHLFAHHLPRGWLCLLR